jgi:hypothetical protein
VITGCPSGNCSSYWALYSSLVKDGWEIASHSRWHVRPPRSPSDYLGSIKDIEGNITGYVVLTYIPPFSKLSKDEAETLFNSTCVRIIMVNWPFQIRVHTFQVNRITKLGFTVKLSQKLPWKIMLRTSVSIARHIGGLVVVYSHATSYDWKDFKDLLSALSYTISYLMSSDSWITTPKRLWLYEVERTYVAVAPINDTAFKVIYDKNFKLCGLKPVPITLVFRLGKGYEVKGVTVNDTALTQYVRMPYIPKEGYVVKGDMLYVSVVPGREEIVNIILARR